MKKHPKALLRSGLPVLIFSILVLSSGCGHSVPPGRTVSDFTEAPDPTADTLADWSAVPAGLQASPGSIDVRYARSVPPQLAQAGDMTLTGWKGEKLSAQLVLWTAGDASEVVCQVGDFASEVATLPSSIAKTRFVRYVITDGPGERGSCGYRKPGDFPAWLSADMLDDLAAMDIPAKTVRPVWITVEIPRDAVAGNYNATITVSAKKQKKQKFDISLEIIDRELPPPSQWPYHIDLWQHPSAIARTANLEMWSSEHFAAMKPVMEMIAGTGQKVITATVNKDPWNVQTYDPYADMIKWTKTAEGGWEYDYSVFDLWVEMMLGMGIDRMINCYSILPWNNELHYTDAKTGEVIDVVADPATPVFEDMWRPFLTDFKRHLGEKGWLAITNIAMDERSPAAMDAAVKLLGEVAPELGIAIQDNHKSYKRYTHVRDLSVGFGSDMDPQDIADRRSRGLISTYYICCSDNFPNVFTFSDPAEAAYLGWHTMARGYDGMLRWAVQSWVEYPLVDSRFRTWGAGDTYSIYPGARSSIRFERLVEGLQDAEKIRLLREEFTHDGNTASLQKLEDALAMFYTPRRTATWNDELNRAKQTLDELSR